MKWRHNREGLIAGFLFEQSRYPGVPSAADLSSSNPSLSKI